MGKRITSSINGAGKTGYLNEEQLGPYLIWYTKINSNQSKDLNIRPKTEKLQEETEKRLLDIGLGSNFIFLMTPKHQQQKQKKKFLHSKESHQQNGKVTYTV